jgi:hypothetical protein
MCWSSADRGNDVGCANRNHEVFTRAQKNNRLSNFCCLTHATHWNHSCGIISPDPKAIDHLSGNPSGIDGVNPNPLLGIVESRRARQPLSFCDRFHAAPSNSIISRFTLVINPKLLKIRLVERTVLRGELGLSDKKPDLVKFT